MRAMGMIKKESHILPHQYALQHIFHKLDLLCLIYKEKRLLVESPRAIAKQYDVEILSQGKQTNGQNGDF